LPDRDWFDVVWELRHDAAISETAIILMASRMRFGDREWVRAHQVGVDCLLESMRSQG